MDFLIGSIFVLSPFSTDPPAQEAFLPTRSARADRQIQPARRAGVEAITQWMYQERLLGRGESGVSSELHRDLLCNGRVDIQAGPNLRRKHPWIGLPCLYAAPAAAPWDAPRKLRSHRHLAGQTFAHARTDRSLYLYVS